MNCRIVNVLSAGLKRRTLASLTVVAVWGTTRAPESIDSTALLLSSSSTATTTTKFHFSALTTFCAPSSWGTALCGGPQEIANVLGDEV